MRTRWATLVAMAVLATALAVPGAASASTTEAIADTGGMTVSLGVLGSPLDVFVTLDEIGHVTVVTVVTVGDGYSEDKSSEHQVRFSHDEDATRVDVRAKEHKLTASVKAADLASILGSHTWSATLFGSDTESSVTFDVIENGSGYPELTNVAVTGPLPADATYEISAIDNELEDDEAESSVRITFMWNGYTMTLKIKAEMEFEDDGDDELSVKLKFELRGKDIQLLRDQDLATLARAHSWDGRLCDGTPVAVGYTIGESGEVTVDTVTVDGAAADGYELDTKTHGFELEFDDSKAKVTVELKQKDDGTWDLKVKSKTTEKCDHDDEYDDDHDDDDDDDHDDDDDKDKDKKHDDDDDDDDEDND